MDAVGQIPHTDVGAVVQDPVHHDVVAHGQEDAAQVGVVLHDGEEKALLRGKSGPAENEEGLKVRFGGRGSSRGRLWLLLRRASTPCWRRRWCRRWARLVVLGHGVVAALDWQC
jgi:hypothetical protein